MFLRLFSSFKSFKERMFALSLSGLTSSLFLAQVSANGPSSKGVVIFSAMDQGGHRQSNRAGISKTVILI